MDFRESSFREVVEPYIVSQEHVRPTKVAYSDVERGTYLYQGDCLEIMEEISRKYPDGCFDMIFADPPYRLSNGGMTCYAGKVAKVDKGIWDGHSKRNGLPLILAALPALPALPSTDPICRVVL